MTSRGPVGPDEVDVPGQLDSDRETELIAAFVDLSAGLADDLDGSELLMRLVEHSVATMNATAAGVILRTPGGPLAVLAASDPAGRTVELAQLQRREGPCVDCMSTGRPVLVADLGPAQRRWPGWRPRALAAGIRSVLALPMTARGVTFGGLNLFADEPDVFSERDLTIGAGLASVATAVVVTNRQLRQSEGLTEQLERALQSRVVIEQAKGVVAAAWSLDVESAFEVVRRFSRRTNQRLVEVADALRSGRLDADRLRPDLPPGPDRSPG